MKKNIFSRIAFAVAVPALMLSSCDYLDVMPPEQATGEDAMETRDRMYNFLSSCYHAVLKQNPLAHDYSMQVQTNSLFRPCLVTEHKKRPGTR